MYQYYEDARVCYVYLGDASGKEDPRNAKSGFRRSRWFMRGWTLQELIAPPYAVFLDKNWEVIGTRWSLRDAISVTTSIPIQVFEGRDIDEYSIAQRMSWAASRETTRPEDAAYCLMGIFGVCMSPIYGEGGIKAFIRLQQEIIKISEDRSIFAWVSNSSDSERGLFAMSPKEFRASGDIGISDVRSIGDKSSFSFNNNGLHIHLPIVCHDDQIFLASLYCKSGSDEGNLFIYLRRINGKRYVRCRPSEIILKSPFNPILSPRDGVDVVIQESLLAHIKRRSKWSNGLYSNIAHRVELLPSVQQSFNLMGHNLPTITDTSFVMMSSRTSQILTFKMQGTTETFSMAIKNHSEKSGFGFKICILDGTGNENSNSEELFSLADRWLLYPWAGSDNCISVNMQILGQRARLGLLQLGTIKKKPNILFTFPGTLRHCPNVHVSVPAYKKFIYGEISLQDAFPMNIFDSWTPNVHGPVQAHISMPDDAQFRLLTYEYRILDILFKFYVALGSHENGEAWTDIFIYKNRSNGEEAMTTICDSYLKSGPIKQVSAFTKLAKDYDVIATIEKRQASASETSFHLLELAMQCRRGGAQRMITG